MVIGSQVTIFVAPQMILLYRVLSREFLFETSSFESDCDVILFIC